MTQWARVGFGVIEAVAKPPTKNCDAILAARSRAGRTVSTMSELPDLRRNALQGAWAAAAAALQGDWDGFTMLIEEGVGSALEASAWAMAAVGGVQAMLRHYDMGSIDWDPAVNAASLGMLDEAVSEVQQQIDEEGPGVAVGRAVGQLAVAITVVARCQQQDPVALAQRLCLDVAVSQSP